MKRISSFGLSIAITTFIAPLAVAQITVVGTVSSSSVPETITQIPLGFGTNAGDYFVPDYSNGNVDILPAAGGALTTFAASGVDNPIGGTFLPTGYGSLSGQYLVESGQYAGGLSAINSSGVVTSISPVGQSTNINGQIVANYTGTPTIVPVGFGSISNQAIFGGFQYTASNTSAVGSDILTLNTNGTLSVFASLAVPTTSSLGYIAPYGLAFAPTGFGSIGGQLVVADGASGTIETVNSLGQASVWTTVPGAGVTLPNGQITGLRQIAFAPSGYGQYAGDLFVSVSGSQFGGGTSGQVDVLSSSGAVVAVLEQGTVGNPYDPRGLTFTNNNQLLIANADPSILSATSSAFTPVPLPASAWLLLAGFGGVSALYRKRRAA